MFDAKFEEQFNALSSVKSRKNSLHQSTAIHMPTESEKNEELVEQERRKAEQAHIEFVQGEQSL